MPKAATAPFPDSARALVRLLRDKRSLQNVARLARQRGQQVFLVGGTVRELLRGRLAPDLDLAVSRQTLEIARDLAAALGGTFILLDEAQRTARVVWQGDELDLAEFRAPTLDLDLGKRDFTLNALALDLEDLVSGREVRLIDPYGGRADLEAGVIRMLAPENFAADPLRLLRTFRFAATHQLQPTRETLEAVRRYLPAFPRVAAERIHHELHLLLDAPRAFPAVRLLADSGLLFQIFPELQDLQGVDQNGYHHLDVFEHSLAALEALEQVLGAPEDYFAALAPALRHYLQRERRPAWLKLAALFHDAGKPVTRQRRDDPERYTFYHHERVGQEIFSRAAARLRCSQMETRTVLTLIDLHMRPFLLLPLFREGGLSVRAVGRLIRAAGGELPGMFALAMADSLAGQGPLKPPDAEMVLADLAEYIFQFFKERVEPLQNAPRLLTGHDLIQELHLAPGPQFRNLLTAVEEEQLEGRLHSRQEALDYVRRLLRGKSLQEMFP